VYASAEACSGKINDALNWERKYRDEGLYAEVFDLIPLDNDDKIDVYEGPIRADDDAD
jgi:hypothetical protein